MSQPDELFKEAHLPSHPPTYRGSNGDRLRATNDTNSMSYVDKDLLNAKLETIEARMDGRVASIEGKIDAFLAIQSEREKANEQRSERLEADVRGTREDLKGLRATFIVTAVSVVIAIVLGVAAFNATLTSNMLSSFQAGISLQEKNESAAATDSGEQLLRLTAAVAAMVSAAEPAPAETAEQAEAPQPAGQGGEAGAAPDQAPAE